MKTSGYHILRVGIGITFFWIGIFILKNPENWGNMITPWFQGLLPVSLKTVMIPTAILDILIGFFLLVDVFTWFFALLGALHLVVVLVTTGITFITVRDLGLLAGLIAIAMEKMVRKGS